MPRKGRGKRKKQTPPGLDFAFKRHLIAEDEYKNFWPKWWDATKKERETIIEELLAGGVQQTDGPDFLQKISGPVVTNLGDAKKMAKAIGGYVVRRAKNGRFSKHGKRFQAIQHRRKKIR